MLGNQGFRAFRSGPRTSLENPLYGLVDHAKTAHLLAFSLPAALPQGHLGRGPLPAAPPSGAGDDVPFFMRRRSDARRPEGSKTP
jgi:hypothetical protein